MVFEPVLDVGYPTTHSIVRKRILSMCDAMAGLMPVCGLLHCQCVLPVHDGAHLKSHEVLVHLVEVASLHSKIQHAICVRSSNLVLRLHTGACEEAFAQLLRYRRPGFR